MIRAYRLSNDELNKMIWLKAIFERNEYEFEPDRFPEIYYDDFNKFKGLKIEHERHEDNTPDYLGVYVYGIEPCSIGKYKESKEGVIILFKDRIEQYSIKSGINECSIRFVVLLHELGHWLTHYAKKTPSNAYWKFGYDFYSTTRNTHEALAQLVAYWASEDDENNIKTLIELSPKNSFGEIDSLAIYGRYINLTKFSKVDVLKKLNEVRKYWYLNDSVYMDFLNSKSANIVDWLLSEGMVDFDEILNNVYLGKIKVKLGAFKDEVDFESKVEQFTSEIYGLSLNSLGGIKNLLF